jgi:hypothetical protein
VTLGVARDAGVRSRLNHTEPHLRSGLVRGPVLRILNFTCGSGLGFGLCWVCCEPGPNQTEPQTSYLQQHALLPFKCTVYGVNNKCATCNAPPACLTHHCCTLLHSPRLSLSSSYHCHSHLLRCCDCDHCDHCGYSCGCGHHGGHESGGRGCIAVVVVLLPQPSSLLPMLCLIRWLPCIQL